MLCSVNGRDLSLAIVREGWAVVVRNVRPTPLRSFQAAEGRGFSHYVMAVTAINQNPRPVFARHRRAGNSCAGKGTMEHASIKSRR